jgi:NAD(P)-dependent dehydrogenase (short-subunit alcohol dehydrogenase family)
MMTHQGKVALVTGGKQGIGRGIADLLAARGASVVIVNREAADDEAEEIGNGAISVAGDVSQEADWALIATQVERAFGRLDILVHAAGIYPTAPLEKMTFGDWRQVLGVNLDAHFLGAKAMVPLMRRSGGGSIVAIGSDSVGLVLPPGMAHYLASKMGVVGLMRALASELAPDNITVNAVHPGITDTEGASGMPDEQKASVYKMQAIKRLGQPADIAGPVAFLTSDDARFITGQTLVADGGLLRL